ncbi:MAG: hypothetical protein J1F11_10205 [Oscillospiraceae bacterium]|nr:hypothetical protein [Oscillospiraceae bacterium]
MDIHTYYFVTTVSYDGVHRKSYMSAILELKDILLIDKFKSICDDSLHIFESLDDALSFIKDNDDF